MRHFIYILMLGLCFSLTAQSRQSMEEPNHQRDGFAAQNPSIVAGTSFFNPGHDALLISDSGTVVIPKLTFGPDKGEFVILPFPGPANLAHFKLQAIGSEGSSLWQYELQEEISWAGNTMISADQVIFLAQIAPPMFPDPDDDGSEEDKQDETRSFKDPAGTRLAGSIPQNVLISISLQDGQELWRQEISGFISAVQQGPAGRIYVSYLQVNAFDGLDEKLSVFDAAGQNLWHVTTNPAELTPGLPE